MLTQDTFFLSVRELGDAIRTRKISPVELTEGYLERCRTIGAKLNAIAALTPELALSQAKQAEAEIKAGHYRGPLHGVPYAVKDLVAVKGYPTTWGAPPYAHQQFDYNATLIERLNEAGAVLLAKAAMIELAGGLGYSGGEASLTGPARNPWNPDCWTCGSSSGSGAMVSAGLAPWALGSDTRGSILCPSAWCNVTGMRPSFGRVSRYGSMAISQSLDKLGPMARSAEDCALVLNVIGGHDPKDHDSVSAHSRKFVFAETDPKNGKPLRIGRLTNMFVHSDADGEKAVDAACEVYQKAGCTVERCEFPDGPYEEVQGLIGGMESANAFTELIDSGRCKELKDPVGRINGYISKQYSSSDYLHAQQIRTMLMRRADALFDRYDVVVALSQPGVATPLPTAATRDSSRPAASRTAASRGNRSSHEPDGVSSLCGWPAVGVPCGFNAKKLPFGMQIMGRGLDDAGVLRAARLYQQHTDWHKQHPVV